MSKGEIPAVKFKGIHSIGQLLEEIETSYAALKQNFNRRANYLLCTIEYIFQEKVLAEIRKRQKNIPGLKTMGHGLLAWWGGEISKGCQTCLHSRNGFYAIRSVSVCNLSCKFCYYSKDTNEELQPCHFEINSKYREVDDIKTMIDKQSVYLSGISWVYYEPFMQLEKHFELIRYIHDAGLYQWMYTNGTLCNEENLKALADSGLDELRFNLAATFCSKKVMKNLKLAKKYFPLIGIESPMFKEYYEAFIENKDEILDSGAEFINCAELHLNPGNIENFKDEELYVYKFGYVSPISSRHYTYDLIELADKESWQGITIHDCSNQTKVYRSINKKSDFGVSNYTGENAVPKGWHLKTVQKHPGYFEKFLDI
jgi:pyruvate formate-lyase activating enzyme-like uncharacterized protein